MSRIGESIEKLRDQCDGESSKKVTRISRITVFLYQLIEVENGDMGDKRKDL
jgi:hypothetical protein